MGLFKRLLFLAIAVGYLSIFSGCRTNEDNCQYNDFLTYQTDYYVPIERAEQELRCLLEEVNPHIKGSQGRIISDRLTFSSPLTKVGEEPLVFHVFNFENDEGYAIMAGDSRVPSVLCFVETGHFSEQRLATDLEEFIMDELTGLYRLARLLPDSLKYDSYPIDHALFTKADTFYPVDTVYTDGKYYVYYNWVIDGQPHGECLSTEWSQNDPFNQQCPMYYDSIRDTCKLPWHNVT